MTTYYVRKSGNDGNGGESKGDAWLTVDNAANNVAAGDTVHIGAGEYAESVTMDTAGSSGSLITFRGDVTGENTDDPGNVIITGHDSYTANPARSFVWLMGGREFVVVENIIMFGATGYALSDSNATNQCYEGNKFVSCAIINDDWSTLVDFNAGSAPTGDGLQFVGCVFVGGIVWRHHNNASADINAKAGFDNCIIIGGLHHTGTRYGFFYQSQLNDTYSIGGIDVTNCLFIGAYIGVYGYQCKNTTNPVRVLNCSMAWHNYGMRNVNGVNNAVYEDYNHFYRVDTVSDAAVQNGGNSDASVANPLLVGGIADLAWTRLMGWSPLKPWEPMYPHPALGAASSSYAPAEDLYDNPRPMRPSGADDLGPVETRARLQIEATTIYAGSYSGMIAGAGYHDTFHPVKAQATTVTLQARYDSNYSGALPTLEVLNIPGVADQSDTMTAAADTWEELSCAFTPTAAGWIRVRLTSTDASASGECYFDELEVE